MLITDEMIERAKQNNKDLRMELALALHSSEVFDLRKSAEIAAVLWMDMATEVKKRGLPAWDVMTPEELEEDWNQLRSSYFGK